MEKMSYFIIIIVMNILRRCEKKKTFYLEVTPIHLDASRSRQTQRRVIGDELVIHLRLLDEDQLTELLLLLF